MTIEELTKRIESAKSSSEVDVSEEGLLRLQEVASRYQGDYRLIWSEEIQEELKKRPQTAMHTTGIEDIDSLLGGLREQMLIGIGAHSGHGKTAMGLYFLKLFQKLNPVLIPLEQSAEELITQRDMNGQFVPRFLSPYRHSSRVRPEWLEERIVEGIAKYNSRFFLIDHLGYMDADKRFDRDPEPLRIERKLQDIKNLAKKWNVVIVILIQITQLDESEPPSLLHLKGSSSIRQECDKVILLWRKNSVHRKIRTYQNETLFSLQKNRWSGKNGNLGLRFDYKTGDYIVDNEWVRKLEDEAYMEIKAEENF